MTQTARMSPDTERVVAWFRSHPGASRYEATLALHGMHVTARMSDARKAGVIFDKVRDPFNPKVVRFRVRESRPVTQGVQEALSL